jgi:hypothetical protein
MNGRKWCIEKRRKYRTLNGMCIAVKDKIKNGKIKLFEITDCVSDR